MWSKIENFTGTLMYQDAEGYPTSLRAEVKNIKDKITVKLLSKNYELTAFPINSSLVFTSSIPHQTAGFEGQNYVELTGILTENMNFIVNRTESRVIPDSQYFSVVQESISSSKDYMRNYNLQLYQQAIGEHRFGILVSSVGTTSQSHKVNFVKTKAGNLQFSLSTFNPIYRYLDIHSFCKFLVEPASEFKTIGQLTISGKVRKIKENVTTSPTTVKFELVPSQFQYGNKTELETEQLNKPVSALRELPENAKSWLKYTILKTRFLLVLEVLIPYLAGSLVAITSTNFNPLFLVLGVMSLIFFHIGANLVNDYFDHKSSNDEFYYRPVVGNFNIHGSSQFIQHGLISPNSALVQGFTFLSIGSGFGLVIFIITSNVFFLLLGIIGAFLAFFYSAPPLKLAHRGLGETTIVIVWIILPFIGGYFLQIDSTPLLQATELFEIFVVLSVSSVYVILLIISASTLDYVADKRAKKYTLAVLLSETSVVYLSISVSAIPLSGIILLCIIFYEELVSMISFASITFFLVFISVLLTIFLIVIVVRYFKVSHEHSLVYRIKIFYISYIGTGTILLALLSLKVLLNG